MLTYIEYTIHKESYSNHRCAGDLKKCFSTLKQLDGHTEVKNNSNNESDVPHCLGNLDCPDENLFHIATLFRGFKNGWSSVKHHQLCDHTKTCRYGKYCFLCLVQSFQCRINDMRLKGKKKSLKPLELMADIIRVREAHSEETTSLVSEFQCHLQELSQCDELRKLTSEVKIKLIKCKKSVSSKTFFSSKSQESNWNRIEKYP